MNQLRNRAIAWIAVCLAACSVVSGGCAGSNPAAQDNVTAAKKRQDNPVVVAPYTATPVKIDGVLDDAIWKTAKEYPLSLSKDKLAEGETLIEGGTVRYAWDDNYLYAAFRFTDSDVVAEGNEDQIHHFAKGDVAELFIKPEAHSGYWEMYVTPHGKKTTYWFPSGGRLGLESCFTGAPKDLQVGATFDGTLNNWEDTDKGWYGEMAVPVKNLTAHGEIFTPESVWWVLSGRYNYSRYLEAKELSMMPALSKTRYHLIHEYARLQLTKE